MHQDVSEAADGRGEVRVERHIEGVVAELRLVLQHPRAEVYKAIWGGGADLRAWPGWVRAGCAPRAGETQSLTRGSLGGVDPPAKLRAAEQSRAGPRTSGAVLCEGTPGAAMRLGGAVGALAPLLLKARAGLAQSPSANDRKWSRPGGEAVFLAGNP